MTAIHTPDSSSEIETICRFWFGDTTDDTARQQTKLWWGKNPAIDTEIKQRFETFTLAAERGELEHWAATAKGLLALILLTDQFPRNMYRATPRSFAFDAQARGYSRLGLQNGFAAQMRPIEQVFLHLPLVHSEVLADQQQAAAFCRALVDQAPVAQKASLEGTLDSTIRHHDIIARFGRFPHRNRILQRQSTAEELAFLQQPGASF
jgi:uncharacterized protein (DUF924 family)